MSLSHLLKHLDANFLFEYRKLKLIRVLTLLVWAPLLSAHDLGLLDDSVLAWYADDFLAIFACLELEWYLLTYGTFEIIHGFFDVKVVLDLIWMEIVLSPFYHLLFKLLLCQL